MKRSIIRMGSSSKGLSLPISWFDKFNLQVGEQIELFEEGDNIKISPSADHMKEITLDLHNANKTAITQALISAYQLGYDRVIINFNANTEDIWDKGKAIETRKVIEGTCEGLIGFDTVELEETKAIVEDITGVTRRDFHKMTDKMFTLLITLGKNIAQKSEKNDLKAVPYIHTQYVKILYYLRYAKRHLTKIGEGEKTTVYFDIIAKQEQIGISLRRLYKKKEKEYCTISPEARKILIGVLDLLEEIQEGFKKFSISSATEIFVKRSELFKQNERLAEEDKNGWVAGMIQLILSAQLYLIRTSYSEHFGEKVIDSKFK